MEGKREIAQKTLERSKWYKHRSTWMMVALLLSLLMLILGFTLAAPVVEVLLVVFTVVILATKIVSTSIACYDGVAWILASSDRFDRFKTWLKEHCNQAIIAGVGIALSLVGLGLMIGLAPVMVPALALACGCSLAFLVFNLVVYGPVTIADAVNNYLDRSEAEKILEDGRKYELVSVVNSEMSGQPGSSPLLGPKVQPQPDPNDDPLTTATTVTKKINNLADTFKSKNAS